MKSTLSSGAPDGSYRVSELPTRPFSRVTNGSPDPVLDSMSEEKASTDGVGEIEVLKHAVLRASAWPIETMSDFTAPDLAKAASALFDVEQRIVARREATVAALHAAIPRFDRVTRAYLLRVKRSVHGQTGELPEPTSSVSAQLEMRGDVLSLIAEEQHIRKMLAERRFEFESMYAAELERQRRALRRTTAEARFLKALIVANPLVATHWMSALGRNADHSQKERRLERTVFRYLTRAVGRPTPNGAWAGVSLISPAPACGTPSQLKLAAIPALYEVTVNLLPFTLMLCAFTEQDRYRQSLPVRLNPTLHAVEGGWRYVREGSSQWVILPRQRLLSALLHHFEDGRGHYISSMLEEIQKDSDGTTTLQQAVKCVVGGLLDEDVLRVDLRFPSQAGTAWEALQAVAARLIEPERSDWSEAIKRIKVLCEQLGNNFEVLQPADVNRLREAIEREVQGLWQAANLPDKIPGPAVRIDMRLPYTVEWSAATLNAAHNATRRLLAFHAADGAAELFRRQAIYSLAHSFQCHPEAHLLEVFANEPDDALDSELPNQEDDIGADPSAATRELLFSRLPAGSAEATAAAESCHFWENLLRDVHRRRIHTLSSAHSKCFPLAGPWGSLLLRLDSNNSVWIGRGRPEPALFVARFANLLRKTENDGDIPLLHELRGHVARAAQKGIELAEITGWHPLNPNVAIRPSLSTRVLDAQGDRDTNLQNLRLSIQPVSLRPWILRPGNSTPVIPVLTCAANLGARDAASSTLAQLASAHGWEFLAFGFPQLSAEQKRWHHVPRLVLDDGIVLSGERWTLQKAFVERLTKLRGADRYLAWRREVERMNLAELVNMHTSPDEPELLMCADSPLAVQCLFDACKERASNLFLTELAGDPESWPVKDAEGRHYLTEVAITWCADQYWENWLN